MANYMGGRRNAAKIRSKNVTLRLQKEHFAKQRLNYLSWPAFGTQKQDDLPVFELESAQHDRLANNHINNQPYVLSYKPRPVFLSDLKNDDTSAEESNSSQKRASEVLRTFDMTEPIPYALKRRRLLEISDFAGLDRIRKSQSVLSTTSRSFDNEVNAIDDDDERFVTPETTSDPSFYSDRRSISSFQLSSDPPSSIEIRRNSSSQPQEHTPVICAPNSVADSHLSSKIRNFNTSNPASFASLSPSGGLHKQVSDAQEESLLGQSAVDQNQFPLAQLWQKIKFDKHLYRPIYFNRSQSQNPELAGADFYFLSSDFLEQNAAVGRDASPETTNTKAECMHVTDHMNDTIPKEQEDPYFSCHHPSGSSRQCSPDLVQDDIVSKSSRSPLTPSQLHLSWPVGTPLKIVSYPIDESKADTLNTKPQYSPLHDSQRSNYNTPVSTSSVSQVEHAQLTTNEGQNSVSQLSISPSLVPPKFCQEALVELPIEVTEFSSTACVQSDMLESHPNSRTPITITEPKNQCYDLPQNLPKIARSEIVNNENKQVVPGTLIPQNDESTHLFEPLLLALSPVLVERESSVKDKADASPKIDVIGEHLQKGPLLFTSEYDLSEEEV